MSREEIVSKITEIFRDVFNDDSIVIEEAMTAEDVEEWDSLSHIDMICMVEEELGVKFITKEISNLNNVGEFITLLENKINT